MTFIDRALAGQLLRVRLGDESASLAGRGPAKGPTHHARTLVKDGPLRVTIIRMESGSRIATHQADGPVTIHALAGRIRVHIADEITGLEAGDLVSLGAGVPHSVESADGGTFLLTLALP